MALLSKFRRLTPHPTFDHKHFVTGTGVTASIIFALLLLTGCLNSNDDTGSERDTTEETGPPPETAPPEAVPFAVEVVIPELSLPWSLAFLPDNPELALITERKSRLSLVHLEDGTITEVTGTPEVSTSGRGGFLDVVLHPNFTSEPWVYLAYTAEGEPDTYAVHLGRGKLNLDRVALEGFELLHVATPFQDGTGHFGGRLAFDQHYHLYLTVSDHEQRGVSQDLQSHHGKTLRFTDNGDIPSDNPFVGDDDALDAIYTYGHRNVQAMAVDPSTTRIWQAEHGEKAGDEINQLERGANFGWPIATYSREYDSGEPIGQRPEENSETVSPAYVWQEEAFPPSGMAFYNGDTFPQWKGSLFVGGLGSLALARFSRNGSSALVMEELLLTDREWRFRDVRVNPHDGSIYLLIDDDPGPLVRLVPADNAENDE
ncbi:MAG: PQQ-dependent sugar dehydrogenase [Ectothiorhodospiraceae bacterium]|nr:PQQ-dependent sugar dehydrogenase [Ectothiorhodospiraceae bacterium]MCH8504022.1 PQQ-dependent sugar dehydrogenase [Ectothiorhodospiraceae bacterium]